MFRFVVRCLLEHELAERAKRRTERHRAESQLDPSKTLASFEFTEVPMLSKAHVMALASGDSLECSRGQQKTGRENGPKVRRKRRIGVGRAQEARAGNRANTGGTGKKNPNRIGVGILSIGGAGGNRTRVRKSATERSTCVSCLLCLTTVLANRQAGQWRVT